jgi:hypothetical protein
MVLRQGRDASLADDRRLLAGDPVPGSGGMVDIRELPGTA